MAKQSKPTEGELEILQVLWEKGKATVREVHEKILESKEAGYTTTLKLMQIMFEKGLVSRDDSAKTHIYQANVSKEKTQTQFVGKMISSLFGGSSTQLVMQALGSQSPSKEELNEIQQLLDNLKNNNMQSLLHSPFLQALGYSIINSLWQFAFLWLLYFFINTIFKLSSHQKYIAGLALEITGFTWFMVTLVFYYNQSLHLQQYSQGDQSYVPGLLTNTGTSLKQQFFLLVLRSERFFPYLSVAYLALLFVLGARWVYAYRFTQQVRFQGLKEIEDNWKTFVQKLSFDLGIERPVNIFLSGLVQTPLTVGFFKPVILIPLATINYLNAQQMEAVILHELAHIKRYDYLFNLVLALIEASLFFNPFMQLIHQQVKKERENCCDDWVLKYEYGAASYARALLQIASNQPLKPLLALGAADDKKVLITRIKRIIEKNDRTFFNHKHQLLALLVLTTVFSSLSFLSPSKKINHPLNSQTQSNIVYEPMAAKVGNPLFNPVFFLATPPVNATEVTEKPGEIKLVTAKIEVNSLTEPSAPTEASAQRAALVSMPAAEDEDRNVIEEASVTDLPAKGRVLTIANNLDIGDEGALKELERRATEVKLEKWFPKEASRQFDLVENHLKQFQREPAKVSNGAIILKQVRVQLNNALEQLKSSKKETELTKLQTLARLGIRKITKERVPTLFPDIDVFNLNELEVIQNQIEKAIDSIAEPIVFTTRLNSDVNYNFQFPAIVYTEPKENEHSFSFEYSTKPRVRVVHAPCVNESAKVQKKKEKVVVIASDENDTDPAEIAPAAPARATRVRSVYVIKI